jgi:hypothetical protein
VVASAELATPAAIPEHHLAERTPSEPVGMNRYFLKHRAQPTVYAVEGDEDGDILGVLDVTTEATSGGLCPHLLSTLPLAGRLDDVEYLQRTREEYESFTPECGNVHHLMTDLLTFEREHRQVAAAFALADGKAKALKKDMELRAAKVHELLGRIDDRSALPLFDAPIHTGLSR